ncbi:MAG: transporter, family, hexuronate transporter [Acidobacteriota bacterium]|jgi:ACS family hexuronate transporter-like MFS transporter|nr:transporter, family, hexuronate transporter [Acidobacteriota bacterium]
MSDIGKIVEDVAGPKSEADAAPLQSSGASATGAVLAAAESANTRIGRYRWVICGLLFFATTVNYVDRLVFGFLGPELMKPEHFGWTAKDLTDIVFWFEVAYAIGLLCAGRFLDWIGTRIGYAVSLTFWSFASIIHAFMSTVTGFSVARFMLGIGESGNFPAAIKTVAEWFPKKERALATGIFNAGSNVGAIIAPLAVPWLYIHWGWQWAFIMTGAIGLVWLIFWFTLYHRPEEHPKIGRAELEHIQSDPPEPTAKVPWLRLLPHRQTWAFVFAKFATDSIWRWYLYLLPLFFSEVFKLDIKNFGPPFVVIYVMADVGSIGGGWLSSKLIKGGRSINFGRKVALLVCALCVVPVALVTQLTNMWFAVGLVGLAAAAHQGWSANLFTTASDMFPKQAVGSVVGLGGMAGAVGAMFILKLTGRLLGDKPDAHSFAPLFIIAASAYVVSLIVIHVLVPRLEPARLES